MTVTAFPTLVLASKNRHKLVELRKLCGVPESRLRLATDYPGCPDVEESGLTFEANALIKARAVRDFTGEWALADDSGLAVDALDGAPGVYSARYAGAHGDDAANNRLLLENLAAVQTGRTARFACALALVAPDDRTFVTVGQCPGVILHEARGANGFGYDPLFLPDGHQKTFAELPSDVKCGFSHRAVAAEKMRAIIHALFVQPPAIHPPQESPKP